MRGLLLCSFALSFGIAGAGCGLTLDLTPPVTDAGGGILDGGVDAIPADATMCETVDDCAGLERTGEPTPCGDYRCDPRGFCFENDLDGDGIGPGCEDERDCDDEDASIGINATIACPSAPPGICGEAATLTCTDGDWAEVCDGVEDAQPESCNGQDDDCNGLVDDGLDDGRDMDVCAPTYACVDGTWRTSAPMPMAEVCGDDVDDDCDGTANDPECILDACTFVSSDTEAGSLVGAVPTLQQAISTTAGDDERVLCLLADSGGSGGCQETRFPLGVDVPPGTTIIGNLRFVGGTVSSCPERGSTHITSDDEGRAVTFRIREAGVVQLVNTTVEYGIRPDPIAISVSTARLITSNVDVVPPSPGFVPVDSVGIAVGRGSELIASQTHVQPYGATSVGIQADQALVALRSGCTDPSSCACNDGSTDGIQGRRAVGVGGGGGAVVMNEGTFAAEQYALCATNVPAVQLDGTSAFVAGSRIQSVGGSDALFATCAADDVGLWLHDNEIDVRARDGDDATGVSIIGSCGALLTANSVVGHAGPGRADTVVGVYCDGAECIVNQNTISGTDGPSIVGDAFGLVCKSAATPGTCRVVTQNTIRATANDTVSSSATGMELVDSSLSYVEGNRIAAGCGSQVVGLDADRSTVVGRANLLVGLACVLPQMGIYIGMDVTESSLSWVGNTMLGGDGGPASGSDCETIGAFVNDSPSIMRNNLFVGGRSCGVRIAADFDDDDAWMVTNGFTLGEPLLYYAGDGFDDSSTLLGAYPLFFGNVFDTERGEASFVDYPDDLRIRTGSPFARTGSAPGGRDIRGVPRGPQPSIGAFEP